MARNVNLANGSPAEAKVGLGEFAGKFTVESFADRDCTIMDLDLAGRLVETAMHDELREQVADYRAAS